MNTIEAYVSLPKFAEALNLHPITIRRAIKSGRIQAFKIGSGKKAHWRIPTSEIGRIAMMDMANKNLEVL